MNISDTVDLMDEPSTITTDTDTETDDEVKPRASLRNPVFLTNIVGAVTFLVLFAFGGAAVYNDWWGNTSLGFAIWAGFPVLAYQLLISAASTRRNKESSAGIAATHNSLKVFGASVLAGLAALATVVVIKVGVVGLKPGVLIFGALYLFSLFASMYSASMMAAESDKDVAKGVMYDRQLQDLQAEGAMLEQQLQDLGDVARTGTDKAVATYNADPVTLRKLGYRVRFNAGSPQVASAPADPLLVWTGTRKEGIRVLASEIENETVARIGVTHPMAAQVAPDQAVAAWDEGRRPHGYAPAE